MEAEAAVGVTKHTLFFLGSLFVVCLQLFLLNTSYAAVLPEERADLMYHSYEGGGVKIDGPSLLIRKNFNETVSISANYYVDAVTSASIDVTTTGASEYTEERTEYSFSATYLNNKSLLSAGFTSSEENDYQADTFFVSVSQDIFGDLTTVNMSYARGSDVVMQNGNDGFEENTDRQNYRLGISQILTPNLIVGFDYEGISDEGFLNNPYRNYRFYNDPNNINAGFSFAQEVYPDTRTSDAAAIRAAYYLPYRAAIKVDYRLFKDDWGIEASNYSISYTHPFDNGWLIDLKYRWYEQESADFYQDIFIYPSQNPKDYKARDKELSNYTTETWAIALSYDLARPPFSLEKSKISLQWDLIQFDYENFRNLDAPGNVGSEPLYNFDADVIKVFFSIWY